MGIPAESYDAKPAWIAAGVGVVVAGTVKRGTLVQGTSLLLGPHAGDASFKLTGIKSIAYKRLPVTKVRPCAPRPCMGCTAVQHQSIVLVLHDCSTGQSVMCLICRWLPDRLRRWR